MFIGKFVLAKDKRVWCNKYGWIRFSEAKFPYIMDKEKAEEKYENFIKIYTDGSVSIHCLTEDESEQFLVNRLR